MCNLAYIGDSRGWVFKLRKYANINLGKATFLTHELRGPVSARAHQLGVPYFVDVPSWRPGSSISLRTGAVVFYGSADSGNETTTKIRQEFFAQGWGFDLKSGSLLGDRGNPNAVLTGMAKQLYHNATYCLISSGDDYTTKRFYCVIQAMCIPIIIHDSLEEANPFMRELVLKLPHVPQARFLNNSTLAIKDAIHQAAGQQQELYATLQQLATGMEYSRGGPRAGDASDHILDLQLLPAQFASTSSSQIRDWDKFCGFGATNRCRGGWPSMHVTSNASA